MPSFGEELRRERELRRITLREVADATKINLRYLEALDRNDFKHLPGGVFNRGFVRAYAQFIGVDPEQMVTAYLQEEQAQAARQARTEQPGSESGALLRGGQGPRKADETKQAPAEQAGGPWIKVGLAVLIVAALIAGGFFVYTRYIAGTTESRPDGEPHDTRPASDESAPAQPAADDPATGSDPAGTASPAPRERPPARPRESDPGPDPPVVAPARAEPRNEPAPAAPVRPGNPGGDVEVTVHIDRPTSGKLNCDNAQIEKLDGMPAGSRLRLTCRNFLVVDALDAGALRIAWPGLDPVTPGEPGEALSGHWIDVRAQVARADTGASR